MNLIKRDLFFNKICASTIISNRIRVRLYRLGGADIGKKTSVCPRCFVGSKDLKIGEGCFINYNVWFNTAGGIEIGNNCNIAYKVTFVTSTHEIGAMSRRAGNTVSERIKVGDGTWIGAGAMIMPGVTIGNGVVIAAGSVVTRDCEDNGIYAGNPARLIRVLDD